MNTNEPAFPIETKHRCPGGDIHPKTHTGLTKREHFAALAMQGLLASDGRYASDYLEQFGKLCVLHADAVLAELSKAERESTPPG